MRAIVHILCSTSEQSVQIKRKKRYIAQNRDKYYIELMFPCNNLIHRTTAYDKILYIGVYLL